MNTNRSPAPRLLCRLIRWRSDLFEATPLAAHLERCPDCRRYFAEADDLDAALRRDATGIRAAPPAGLDQAILGAIGGRTAPGRRKESGWAWAGVATAVAAALFISLRLERNPARTGGSADVSAEVVALADVAQDWTDQMLNSTLPSAKAMVEDNALRQEADALYADARSAADFLALNFLPTPTDSAVKPVPPGKT